MNIYDFAMYVNQDVDDTFSVEEIARWFNKAVANFNLIPPVTKYPFINMDAELTTAVDEFVTGAEDTDASDGSIGAYTNYPLSNNFMLAVMLPYLVSAVKSQEASLSEKQLAMSEFLQNARTFKSIANIPTTYLEDGEYNPEIDLYRIGENVYLTDFNEAPFAGDWSKATSYKEVTITRNSNNELVKYVDDSLIDEEV